MVDQAHEQPAGSGSWSHEPTGYDCPFCRMQGGTFDRLNAGSDVVAVTEHAFARVSPRWWPANPGAVLVVTRQHHENLYALPAEVGHAIWDLTRQVAVAIRSTYGCAGVSTRQHNEPDGGQDVWHFHQHVFPRHAADRLYERHAESQWAELAERAAYADLLAAHLRLPRSFD